MARSRARVPEPMLAEAVRPAAPVLKLIRGTGPRHSRVRDVQARIAAGYYDRDEVRSRLADAVLRLMRRP